MKKLEKLLFHRVLWFVVSLMLQFAVFGLMIVKFQEYFIYFYGICIFLSIIAVLALINGKSNPGYQIAWVILILAMPIFGGLIYLLLGGNKTTRRMQKKMSSIEHRMAGLLHQKNEPLETLEHMGGAAVRQSQYIRKYAYCPVWENTQTEYFPLGEAKFVRMLEELKKAEKFIFLEYFIVGEGEMWDSILEILKQKAKSGVDVRMIFDDFGCARTLPYHYEKTLEKDQIKCCVFNPLIPIISFRFNNRDHRKICVIDGKVGFTGGINLADEYINRRKRFGHWKDTAILLRGEAVWNLTTMFLSMWNYLRGENEEDCRKFAPPPENYGGKGLVQPYADNPLDDEPVGQAVYLNLINKAEKYVYLITPYLVIDHEMETALIVAAKSGVDVRIITPHIPDKWYVHAVTRSYYEGLIKSGVCIYEYTPGFVHAKTVVSDDRFATVGTINFDYRSLFLHFECGVWMAETDSVMQIKQDFLDTLAQCQQISLLDCQNVSLFRKLGRAALRVFAPLM